MTAAEAAIVQAKEAVSSNEEQHPGSVLTTPIPVGLQVASLSGGLHLMTTPRQQTKNIYCGPASAQDVSDWAWGLNGSQHKYSQSYISSNWTLTDKYGFTYVYLERAGLNSAVGSKMPSGFTYSYYQPTSGSDWHAKLRTDVGAYFMPQVVTVSPKEPNFAYWLPSWANTSTPAGAYGHYIPLTAYDAPWDGTRTPNVGYDDSAGGYGGTVGYFEDHSYDMWMMIDKANANHAAPWIIW